MINTDIVPQPEAQVAVQSCPAASSRRQVPARAPAADGASRVKGLPFVDFYLVISYYYTTHTTRAERRAEKNRG